MWIYLVRVSVTLVQHSFIYWSPGRKREITLDISSQGKFHVGVGYGKARGAKEKREILSKITKLLLRGWKPTAHKTIKLLDVQVSSIAAVGRVSPTNRKWVRIDSPFPPNSMLQIRNLQITRILILVIPLIILWAVLDLLPLWPWFPTFIKWNGWTRPF